MLFVSSAMKLSVSNVPLMLTVVLFPLKSNQVFKLPPAGSNSFGGSGAIVSKTIERATFRLNNIVLSSLSRTHVYPSLFSNYWYL